MDYYIPASDQHKRKERARARELRQSQWWKQQLASGICYYCQARFAKEDLTMDHKVPVARGGTSAKGNVVPCCKDCNSQKKHKTPVEMLMDDL